MSKKKNKQKQPALPVPWYAVWGHSDGEKTIKLVHSADNAFCLQKFVAAKESGKYDYVTLEPDNPPKPRDYTPGYSSHNRND